MGTVAFCIGGTAFQFLCSAFQICGATEKVYARIGYVMFAFFWIIISVLFLYFGHYILDVPFISGYIECYGDPKEVCLGISAVYRTSFALATFHGLMGLLCTCGGQLISKINEGAWPVKFITVVLIFVLSFFIPNSFFRIYGYVAMVPSFCFIVYEMLLLIDLAYAWNSNWVGKYDASEGAGCGSKACWAVLLIVFTVIFFGLAIIVHVMLLMYEYNDAADFFIILLPMLAAGVYTVLSVTSVVEGGSIFTCSLIFFFGSFITASALFSKPTQSSPSVLLLQIVIGLLFMFFVLIYVGAQTVKSPAQTQEEKPAAQKVTGQAVAAVTESADNEGKEKFTSQDKDEAPEVTLKTAMFHMLMMFASVYYSMEITNWGSPKIQSGINPTAFSDPWVGYGVMLAAQWIGILLFVWSLIAPRVCPDREFA